MSFRAVFKTCSDTIDQSVLTSSRAHAPEQFSTIVGKSGRVGFLWSGELSSFAPGQRPALAEIEDRYWLLGRVRLDARNEVVAALDLETQMCVAEPSDAFICLRAYLKWGERLLDHLRGDFCFVIWDEERGNLICARDQLGIRSLFYTRIGDEWHISDSLESLVSLQMDKTLDDYWIADFLVSGLCSDFDRTVYRNIHRLPPAHMLVVSPVDISLRKYWSLAISEPLNYLRPEQYIEHFHDVLNLAISDRLPPTRVGISMSGGLDSSTLAAQTLRMTKDPARIVAHSCHFERLIADDEKRFSTLVADRLGIELIHQAVDSLYYDCAWYTRRIQTAEPSLFVTSAEPERRVVEQMSALSSVWFYGEGPDNALAFDWKPYLRWLASRRDWGGLAHAMINYLRSKQTREWRATFGRALGLKATPSYADYTEPIWLSHEFATEIGLPERLLEITRRSKSDHPWHPKAVASFKSPIWQSFFESFEPALYGSPLDWRHPYLDLRVLQFLLSVPPIPWARRKRILREAMRGILPDEILRRDKTPLGADPTLAAMHEHPLPSSLRSIGIWKYLDETKTRDGHLAKIDEHQLLRIHVLDAWLRNHEAT